jgi:hypothetical protein
MIHARIMCDKCCVFLVRSRAAIVKNSKPKVIVVYKWVGCTQLAMTLTAIREKIMGLSDLLNEKRGT